MNKYNHLLLRVAKEYNIEKGLAETDDQWKIRCIYSVLGQMALASLLDKETTDDGSKSIMHMKNRIEDLLDCYNKMYPEIKRSVISEPEEVADEIFDVFLKNGLVYHEQYRISMAAPSSGTFDNLTFIRGYSLETKREISGLGAYTDVQFSDKSVFELFLIDNSPLNMQWNNYIKELEWKRENLEGQFKYLRIKPPFNRGYWNDIPDKSGNISLLRTDLKGTQLYYYYKYEGKNLLVNPIANWKVDNHEYRNISNACLESLKQLPPTRVSYDGAIVHFRFEYLPPPAELNFWKLYSWPETNASLPSNFNRICSRKVFEVIRHMMEQKGYKFVEEKNG